MDDPNIRFASDVSDAIRRYTGKDVRNVAEFTSALESWSVADGLIKYMKKMSKELNRMALEMEKFRDDHRSKATHAVIVCDNNFVPSVKPASKKIVLTARIPTPEPEPAIVIEEKTESRPFKIVGPKGRALDSYKMTASQARNLPMSVKRAVHYSYYFNTVGFTDDNKSFTVEAKPISILRPYNTFVITPRVKQLAVDYNIISEEELKLMEIPDMRVRGPDENLIKYVLKYFDVVYDEKEDYMYPLYFSDVYQKSPEELPIILKNIVLANSRRS